jgi:hypothetical protein
MTRRLLLVLAAVAGFAAPAFGSQCPVDIKKIDAALAKNPSLTASQIKPVKTMRDMGARLHKAGRHGDSVKALAGAKDMLKGFGISVD